MHRLHLADPAWRTTFPHLIAPLLNEWIAGLLLRCDEMNGWGSGTTLGHVLRPSSKRSAMNALSSIVPTVIDLEALAARLSVPVSAIVATTYLAELARLYDVAHPHAKLLASSFVFQLCPACMAEQRRLSRQFALPSITHCPQHQISLLKTCQCGAPLRLFHRQARPFTCHRCGLDWKTLPQRTMDPERLEVEHHLLSYYDFFFTKGTPPLLASTLRLIYDSVVEQGEIRVPLPDEALQASPDGRSYQITTRLCYLVHALWQLNLSPRDVVVYAGPLPWRSIRWMTFQCPEPHCPYVTMIRDRTRMLEETEDHGQEVVHKLKDRTFFGPRVSHFLKGEPKIGISEDKGTNRGHPHEQITLANTVISASTSSSGAVSHMCKKKTRKKWRCEFSYLVHFMIFHGS